MSTDDKAPRPARPAASSKKAASELERRLGELELRQRELSMNEVDRPSPWRSPLTIAIAAAAVAALGNALVSYMNATSQARLEQVKAEQNLIIEAIKTGGDVESAAANLSFLVNTGLITDRGRSDRIKAYIRDNGNRPDRLPSLPSSGQTQPPAPRPRAPEQGAGTTARPAPISNSLARQGRMAIVQLAATPSAGLRSYRLRVDGRDVQMGADHRARIQIAGACGDRSVHRLSYTLMGAAGSKLNVAMACGGNPISATGEIEVREEGEPFAAGAQDFRL